MNEKITNLYFQEIDFLRGIALLMMITNHFGHTFLTTFEENNIIFRPLIFSGSFAPVVFFFVSGLGYGINSYRSIKKYYWLNALYKAIILILVERSEHILDGNYFGMDFLSFIAFIIIALSAVRWFQLRIKILLMIVFILIGIRFLIGPLLKPYLEFYEIISWLFGIKSIHNFSYPITPWLVYPFLGYILGKIIRRNNISFLKLSTSYYLIFIITGTILFISLLVVVYLKEGFILHRWGTMSLDYFIVSIVLLALLIFTSPWFCKSIYAVIISIEGITSLLVVPVHYFILKLNFINFKGGFIVNIWNLLVVILSSYVIANSISLLIKKIKYSPYVFYVIFSISLAIVFYLKINHQNGNLMFSNTFLFILQVNIAALFLVKPTVYRNGEREKKTIL